RLSARRRSCTPGRKRSECYFAIRQSHRLDPQHTNLSVRPLDIPARLIPCPPDTEYLEETLSTSLAYQTINPATGEVLKQYPIIDDNDVEVIANRSNEAFTTWRTLTLAERAAKVANLADLFEQNVDELAAIM